ncbi:MAG: OmpA family protein [Pseudomonadota bacterium]
MRAILIVAVLATLVAGGWSAWTYKAPAMEDDVDTRAEAAVLPLATHLVTVATDGRHVTLSGLAGSPEERDRLLEAAAIDGRVAVIDRLDVLDRADPFSFSAVKAKTGAFALTGVVPTAGARDALEEEAKRLSTGKSVISDLALAAGAPEGDWQGMAVASLRALAPLEEGRATIDGLEAKVTGLAPDDAGKATAEEAIAAAPLGTWAAEIDVALPLVQPYRFAARKQGGDISFDGVAPDEATMTRLRERMVALAPGTAEGDMTIARGMPDADWPGRVETGLGALALLDTGQLSVADNAITLSGEIEDEVDRTRLDAVIDPAWTTDISVRQSAPPAELSLAFGAADGVAAEGTLPAGIAAGRVAAMLPGLDLAGIQATGSGDAAAWEQTVAALGTIAAGLDQGEATLREGRVTLSGTLGEGVDRSAFETRLTDALPAGWQAEIALADAAAAPAEISFVKSDAGIRLSGTLPPGTDLPSAFADADQGALETTGGGDAAGWTRGLNGLGTLLTAYSQADGRMQQGALEIEGTLAPGQTEDDLARWAPSILGPDWTSRLSGSETVADDGAERVNLSTGEAETLTRGYWLPEVQIQTSVETCTDAAKSALEAEKITFVTGSAEIDDRARALLNRLSAVAIRCLGAEGIKLEVAGHTDSVGNDAANQTLSQARAAAVTQALEARGVPAEAITAIGYGETQPIADNDTETGRAQNRRIDFTFTE